MSGAATIVFGLILFLLGIAAGAVIVISSLADRPDIAKRLVTTLIIYSGGVLVFGNNGFVYSLLTGVACGGIGTLMTLSLD